jgi:hypothetical protein
MLTRTKSPKPVIRVCKVCKESYEKQRMGQRVCGPKCAVDLARIDREKKEADERRDSRAADRKRKEEMMSRPEWVEAAQKAFNAYIRARDADKPCICCGKPFEPQKFGGSMDAGHYLSRGAAPHLRFDERNCHGQRKNCNRPGGTTREAFRAGMIARIGLEAVEALEADQTPRKYSIAELKEIKATYKRKLKELKGAA